MNMKTLRPTGKLKSRKTIRKMTPMARKLAHLTRSAQSVVTRLKYLTDELQRLEMERAAFERQAQHVMQTWAPPPSRDPVLGPEMPNGEGIPDPRSEVCRCGHVAMIHDHLTGACTAHVGCPCKTFLASGITESEVLQGGLGAGYHEGSDADPRD